MVKTTPFTVPSISENANWLDSRGVRYVQDGVPYLTTHELGKELGMYPETLFRWCVKWFGKLPAGRAGAKMGYRIPLEYRRVARVWLQTEDPRLREAARRALVADPRPFVVVVANLGSTHYSVPEVVGRVESLQRSDAFRHEIISVIFTGDDDTER